MSLLSRLLSHRFTFGTALWTLTTLVALAANGNAQTFNWVQQTVGTTSMNAVAYSPERGERIAVGASGALILSQDALTWTTGVSGTGTTLYGAAWGSGQYVAVGTAGLIRTSPDAVTWTTRTSGTTNDLMAVAWISPSTTGAGQWIAVGLNGTVLTSPTGVTWTKRTSGVENLNPNRGLRAVTWANPSGTPAGIALVVGDNGTILTSTNDSIWTSRTSNTTNALFGVAWTGIGTGTGTALIAGNAGTVLTSTNTTSWTSRPIAGGGGPGGGASPLLGVAWAPGTGSGQFVTGGSATNSLLTSTNLGVNWSQINLTGSTLKHAVWDGSHFIVLGSNGRMVLSHDGVLPGIPILKTPADSAAGVSLTPSLNWFPVSGIKTYHIEISTSSTFASPVFNDTAVTDTTCLSTSLNANTDFYWRVRGRNVAGAGSWSSIRKFKTLLLPPAAPILGSPANKATGTPAYTQFTWSGLGAATGYQLQLALDSVFSAPVLNDSTLTSSARYAGPLSFGSTYYWRVRAYNAGGNGVWSSVRSFATEPAPTSVPPAPVLVTPAIFSTNVQLSPTFIWNNAAGALSYQVQVSTAPTLATTTLNDSSLTKTNYSGITLTGSTDYYWRVRARNSFGTGAWSDLSTFTTLLVAPEVPMQSTPVAFATAIATPVDLTWGSARGAATYFVQLSLNPEFSTFVLRDSTVTGLSRTSGSLTGSTSYYWRVRAKNTAGISEWSSILRFTTAAVQIVAVAAGLHPVEDMRFDGVKTLRFDLSRTEHVTIRIYDLRGGTERILLDETRPAGAHTLQLPRDLHKGLHMLDYRVGSIHETVKVLF